MNSLKFLTQKRQGKKNFFFKGKFKIFVLIDVCKFFHPEIQFTLVDCTNSQYSQIGDAQILVNEKKKHCSRCIKESGLYVC